MGAKDFSTEAKGLPAAGTPDELELSDGDAVDLRIAPAAKQLGDDTVRMLAYNGSIPGPTLKVPQGSEVIVNVTNEGDLEATVHWHGLRLENRYDGTHETQAPIQVGESFAYRIEFPDPGVYWYHPHIREDYGQELGLYGNILVTPTDPDYWPPANREILLTLDDILIEDGKVASFSESETSYVAMGRFGNVLLVSGEPELALTAQPGEVVRFYLTNTANTRVFKVALNGAARMKLVGGDSGHYEQEQFVDDVVLAPSERVVVDVLFEEPGEVTLEHRTPDRSYRLADITVSGDPAQPSLREQFEVLRSNSDMVAERKRIEPYLASAPDKTIAFVAEMDMGGSEGAIVLCLPDASRGGQREARPLSQVRDEAAAAHTIAESDGPMHTRAATRLTRARARDEATAGTVSGQRTQITGTTGTPHQRCSTATGSNGKTTWSTSTG